MRSKANHNHELLVEEKCVFIVDKTELNVQQKPLYGCLWISAHVLSKNSYEFRQFKRYLILITDIVSSHFTSGKRNRQHSSWLTFDSRMVTTITSTLDNNASTFCISKYCSSLTTDYQNYVMALSKQHVMLSEQHHIDNLLI